MDLKIISGGETGAERAALDAAVKRGVPYGGWARSGRKTEDGPLPDTYRLEEMPTTSTFQWRKQNILYSYGTVILSNGRPDEDMLSVANLVRINSRPLLLVDLSQLDAREAGEIIHGWIREHKIKMIYITGPTAGEDPEIYARTLAALDVAFRMEQASEASGDRLPTRYALPKTVDEAVERLIEELPLKARTLLARMDEEELGSLPFSLVRFMRERLDSWLDSDSLMESCRALWGDDKMHPDHAPVVILRALWMELRKRYGIQVIKGGHGWKNR